jgi:hypothetical protein
MMIALLHILGRGDDDWTKVVGGLIFVAFWAISAISQWANKQKKAGEEARRREVIRQQFQSQEQPTPPQVQVNRPVQISEGIARRFPEVLRPPRPVARKPVPIPQRPKARRAAPPPLPRTVIRQPAPPVPMQQPVPVQPARSVLDQPPTRPLPSGAGAPAIAKWLSPKTLRQQFILTEIFQPPLALREKRIP